MLCVELKGCCFCLYRVSRKLVQKLGKWVKCAKIKFVPIFIKIGKYVKVEETYHRTKIQPVKISNFKTASI